MRKKAAFHFIPELVGDFTHVIELSNNPIQLYIETAINTLHMASHVFASISEHRNTEQKKKTEDKLRREYSEMEKNRYRNYEEEVIKRIDLEYEKVKIQVKDGNLKDKEVLKLISSLKKELHKEIAILQDIRQQPEYQKNDIIEELLRRTLRDYNKLLSLVIEEGNENG